jgi:hypothetical protein
MTVLSKREQRANRALLPFTPKRERRFAASRRGASVADSVAYVDLAVALDDLSAT